MHRRHLLLGSAAAALTAATLAIPAVHWTAIGWWRGEPLWQHRPLSWWRGQVAAAHIWTSFSTRNGVNRREVGCWVEEPTAEGFGPVDVGGLQVLLALLEDSDPKVRSWAAYRLGFAGPQGRAALPSLRKAAKDTAEVMDGVTVGDAATDAVRHIEEKSRDPAW
jgi:hypothetical protein